MPSIDDPAVFLTGMTEGERIAKEERGMVNEGDGFGCNVDAGEQEEEEDAVLATPVRKTSVGMIFSDAGEEEEGEEGDHDHDHDNGESYGFDRRDRIDYDDVDDSGSVRDGCFEDNERSGYEGYMDGRNAGENGYGHDHHVSTTFSTPTTVITPLPDPDQPLPSIEPYSSPAYSLSSPKSRSVSKSAGNTPSSHHLHDHRQQRNSSDNGSITISHPRQYDDNTTALQHHLRDQYPHDGNRHRNRRRTSLSTNLSATSTISSLPSSVLGLGNGSFEHQNDPTSAFAPMSRRPRPVVNRSEMLRMMPRSVPAKIGTSGGGGGLVNGKDRNLANSRVGSSYEISMIDGDDEIDSPSRGKGRSGRSRMMSKGEGMYGDGRSSLSLMSSNNKDSNHGDCDDETDRQIQSQSALVLPPSPSPSPSLSPSSSSSQTRSHRARHHQQLQSHYHNQTQARAHTRTQTRLQSPMTGAKFFTPQPQLPPPLVLLHATILPPVLPLPYSPTALSALAPPFIQRNARLLAEKIDAQVLARGVLVAHPHEDYELLEERILESLELVIPRISVCGHFLGGDSGGSDVVDKENEGEELEEEVEEVEDVEEEEEEEDIGNGRIIDEYIQDHDNYIQEQKPYQGQITSPFVSTSTSGAAAARPHCTTCTHPLRVPFSPADLNPNGRNQLISHADHSNSISNDDVNNASTLRWDVRVYAANGLMRAGAWATAWREMERVDVQIGIWIPEGLKGRLEEWDREHGYVDGAGAGAGDFNGVEDDDGGDNNYLYDLDKAVELKDGEETETETEAKSFRVGAKDGDDGHERNIGSQIKGGSRPKVATEGYNNNFPRTPTASDTSSSPAASKSDRRQYIPISMHMHDDSVAHDAIPAEQSRESPDLSRRPEGQFKHNNVDPDFGSVSAVTNNEAGDRISTPANMPSSPPPFPTGLGTRIAGAARKDTRVSLSSSSTILSTEAKDHNRIILSPSPYSFQQEYKQQPILSPSHEYFESGSIPPEGTSHRARSNMNQPIPSSKSSQPATNSPSHFDPAFSSISSSSSPPQPSNQTTSSASSSSSLYSSSSPPNTHQPTSTSSKPYTSLISRHPHQPQNIIIILLSVLVAFLAVRGGPAATTATTATAAAVAPSASSVRPIVSADLDVREGEGVGTEEREPMAAVDAAAEPSAVAVELAAKGAKEREVEEQEMEEAQLEEEEVILPPKFTERQYEHDHGTVNAAAEAEAEAEAKAADSTQEEILREDVDGGEDLVDALLDS